MPDAPQPQQPAPTQRTITTGGGDYAEGSIDKRTGTFVGGNLVVLADPAHLPAALGALPDAAFSDTALFGLPATLLAQLTGQSLRGYQPRPRLSELFSIIDDPDQVVTTIFRSDPGRDQAPYAHAYAYGRNGVADLQAALGDALLASGGRLLVRGRSGIGKTREVAELARTWCANGWTIGVAKSAGDADDPDLRLDALAVFPPELANNQLLLIIDDLHLRTTRTDASVAPYAQRLDALLTSIEASVLPGSLLVIAVAPSERRFAAHLGIDPQRAPWDRFTSYDLPEFTDDGLAAMLRTLASTAGVSLETDAAMLVAQSDRRPATLVANVALARAHGRSLDESTWQSTRGLTWEQWLVLARRTYPATDAIRDALRLLDTAGLPTRAAYVQVLSTHAAGAPTQAAIDGLVDLGMLLRRADILTNVGDERDMDSGSPTAEEWQGLIEQIQMLSERPAGWHDDLVALATGLLRASEDERAEAVASFAIAQGADTARAYLMRGIARFMRADWRASEADLTAAIVRGLDDSTIYSIRGSIRNLLGDYAGLISDMDAAFARGDRSALGYALRGWAYHAQGETQRAEADLTMAIALDSGNPFFFWARSVVRQARADYAGVERDLTTLLERHSGLSMFGTMATALQAGDVRGWVATFEQAIQPAAPPTSEPQDDGFLYLYRGWMRLLQANYAGAESDLTEALTRGIEPFMSALDQLRRVDMPALAAFRHDWARVSAQIRGGHLSGVLRYVRGVARAYQSKLGEAEADIDSAIAGGLDDAEAYWWRARIRETRGAAAAAEADYSAAIERGRMQAEVYRQRGTMRLQLRRFAEAVADFDSAIAAGLSDPTVFLQRGVARRADGKLAEAEADFDRVIAAGQASAMVYLLRGMTRDALGRPEAAAADLATAAERGQGDLGYLVTHAEYALEQGHPEEAERDLALALEQGAQGPYLLILRGQARLAQRRPSEAEDDFSAALALVPNADTWFLRGRTRFLLKRWAEAEEDLDAAVTAGRADASVYALRAVVRFVRDDYAGADQDAGEAFSRGYTDGDLFAVRGQARRRLDRFAEAQADFDCAITHGQADGETYRERGMTHFFQQHWAESEADFDTAIGLDSEDVLSIYGRGAARFFQGRFAAAEMDLSDAIARGHDPPDVLEQRALALLAQGKVALAEQHLAQLLVLHPEQDRACVWQGAIRFVQGQWEAALADYDLALAHDYTGDDVLVERVRALVRLGRIDEAQQTCHAAETGGNLGTAAWRAWGDLLLARREYSDAVEQFAHGAAETGDRASHFALGLAQLLAGQPDAAQTSYTTGLGIADDQAPWSRLCAMADLDYWVAQQPERVSDSESNQVLTAIRQLLTAGNSREPRAESREPRAESPIAR